MSLLILEEFFPYHTRLFYRQVSSAVTHVYETRYGLKPYEWRTMAILGPDGDFTANEIVTRSSMDKVSVSRAITSLKQRKWILSKANKHDGRSRLIRLSAAGKTVYQELVPLMLEVEQKLLSVYTTEEVAELRRLMAKIADQDCAKFVV
ncbi:MAG: winged helix-turn-helix transcriptional regulator [Rhodobacter sp.]|nr:winged helix-turn-helix transcriptional regulator [Paracoccaceae bacterium]MCC0080895.1 winged helix-turn-helix transcriptional regulator [Rhodobacter sp.]